MVRAWVFIAAIVFGQSAVAGCVEINGKHFCGAGECVALNGVAYCAYDEFGKVYVRSEVAYCGAGECMENDGNVYCSQYSGGSIIKHDHSLFTGPGECVIHDHRVQCAKKPRGHCFVENGAVICEGGTVVEIPRVAEAGLRAPGLD